MGGNASESVSRLGGGLALKFNDPASFILFIEQLANHVRMTYGDIASFVKDGCYPLRVFPTEESVLAELQVSLVASTPAGAGSSFDAGTSNNSSSAVSAGTRRNAAAISSSSSSNAVTPHVPSVTSGQLTVLLNQKTIRYEKRIASDDENK